MEGTAGISTTEEEEDEEEEGGDDRGAGMGASKGVDRRGRCVRDDAGME